MKNNKLGPIKKFPPASRKFHLAVVLMLSVLMLIAAGPGAVFGQTGQTDQISSAPQRAVQAAAVQAKSASVPQDAVQGIVFQPTKQYEFTEYDTSCGQIEEQGTENEWFRYHFQGFVEGDLLTVKTSQGDFKYTFQTSDQYPQGVFASEADPSDMLDINQDIQVTDNQDTKHWAVGENEGFIIEYLGFSSKAAVTIKENPIRSIRYVPAEEYTIFENTHGTVRNKGRENEYFEYYLNRNSGDKLIVVTDEGEKEFVYNNAVTDPYYEAADGDRIPDGEVFCNPSSDQYSNHWQVGTNYFTVTYMGRYCQVPVTITQDQTGSIQFAPNKDYAFYENDLVHGSIRNEGTAKEYFHYRFPGFASGDRLTVHTEDGDITYEYQLLSGNSLYAFVNDADSSDILREYIDVTPGDGNQEAEPWKVGENEGFTIDYHGVSCSVPVTIMRSQVRSIRFTPAEEYTFYEYTHGHWDGSDDDRFFRYQIDKVDGDKLVVVTDNGRKDYIYQKECFDGDYYIYDDDDRIPADDVYLDFEDQGAKHWTTGTYEGQISYQGKSYALTATIRENPVESVEYVPVGSITITEGTRGEYEIDKEGHEYFRYHQPNLNLGDKLIIKTAAGTKTYEWRLYGRYPYTFVNTEDENDVLEPKDDFRIYDQQEDTHWSVGSDNYILLDSNNITCRIPVTILKNPVKSIEYTPIFPWKFKEGEGPYSAYFMPGDVLTVNTYDGAMKYVYRNLFASEQMGFINKKNKEEIIPVEAINVSDDQAEHPWGAGEHAFKLSYMGRTCDLKAVVVERKSWSDADEQEQADHQAIFDAYNGAYLTLMNAEIALGNEENKKQEEEYKAVVNAIKDLQDLLQTDDPATADINAATEILENALTALANASGQGEDGPGPGDDTVRKDNTMTVTANKITVKYKKLRKKTLKIDQTSAFTVDSPQGDVTFKLTKKDTKARKKITVSESGLVTVKKGLKKGKYKVVVMVTAAGNTEYKPGSAEVTLPVRVK